MGLGQEANDDNLGKYFRSSTQQWYFELLIRIASMSIHSIQFHDEIGKLP